MICLYCHSNIQEEPDIITLFKKPSPLCLVCRELLTEWRTGLRCDFCHRLMEEDWHKCMDCDFLKRRFTPPAKITCLLEYNQTVKMLFHRYKFMGDYALSEVLAELLDIDLQGYDAVIPIPLSENRFRERGYNQTATVLEQKRIVYKEALVTTDRARQSELSKVQRVNGENPFSLLNGSGLRGQRLLLVDDIYTTGMTVHHALEKLYTISPASVDVLTFSKA